MPPTVVRILRGRVSAAADSETSPEPAAETLHDPQFSNLLSGFRPQDALVHFRHRAHSFVDKFLQPLAAIRLRRVNVALRVCRDAVDGVELARLASTVAEIGNFLKGVAQQDVNLLIGSI